jgi:hypothetical protein
MKYNSPCIHYTIHLRQRLPFGFEIFQSICLFLPILPNGAVSLEKKTYVAEAMFVAFGELTFSLIVGYSSERKYFNPWIHEGFPQATPGGLALTKASDLSFHHDMSYHPEAPDILGLINLREGHDRQLRTELIDNREILETLPDTIVAML